MESLVLTRTQRRLGVGWYSWKVYVARCLEDFEDDICSVTRIQRNKESTTTKIIPDRKSLSVMPEIFLKSSLILAILSKKIVLN